MEQRRLSYRDGRAFKIAILNNRVPGAFKLRELALVAIALIQLSLLGVSCVLTELCDTRAGVMRHIYYRSGQFSHGIFSDLNLNILSAAGLLFALVFAVMAWRLWFRPVMLRASILIAGFLSVLLVCLVNISWFVNQIPYYYYIISALISWFLQILAIAIAWRSV